MLFGASLVSALVLGATSAFAANHFGGLTVANAVGGNSAYTCRTQAQWNTLAQDAKSWGFPAIRIEGFDCNALDMVSQAAKANGLKVFAGIYISGTVASSATSINNDVQTFRTAYGKYGRSLYVGLSIGNEVADTAANIMAKVYDVRGYLTQSSIGVFTPVGTAHTWYFVTQNPSMCGADFIAANAHGWYDPHTTSGSAGTFMSNTVLPGLHNVCPKATILISETGWPSRGTQSGPGVASVSDETTALSNLNCAAQSAGLPIYAFEYDDQLWKSGAVEQSFGIKNKINLNGGVFAKC